MTTGDEAALRSRIAELEHQLDYMTGKYQEERDAERKVRRALYAGARRYAREKAATAQPQQRTTAEKAAFADAWDAAVRGARDWGYKLPEPGPEVVVADARIVVHPVPSGGTRWDWPRPADEAPHQPMLPIFTE